MDNACSLLAVGLNYFVDAQPEPGSPRRAMMGRDYHRVVEQRLRRVGRWLLEQRPDGLLEGLCGQQHPYWTRPGQSSRSGWSSARTAI